VHLLLPCLSAMIFSSDNEHRINDVDSRVRIFPGSILNSQYIDHAHVKSLKFCMILSQILLDICILSVTCIPNQVFAIVLLLFPLFFIMYCCTFICTILRVVCTLRL